MALDRPSKDNTDQTHRAAFAICSTKDEFNKKMGRTIATGRLNKDDTTVKLCKQGTLYDISYDLLEKAIEHDIIPQGISRTIRLNGTVWGLGS
jgi:hypothetical protein